MKKLIIFLSFIGLSLVSFAQNDTTRYTMVNGYGFTYNRLKAKAALVMPTDTVQNKLPGCVVILNDTLYLKTATRWEKVAASASVIDTTIISTRAWRQKGDDSLATLISLRVRISDTASMLAPYLRKADTLTLSLRIDQRVKYSDTAAMLAPYAKAVAGLPIGGTAGQILAKNSATNYDVAWIDNYTTDVREYVKASVAINKGQAVYVSGADGTNVLVSKASNTTEATSSKTLGLMFQDLAQNGQGFVIIQGKLSGLNTLGTTVGDPVWLGTNGNLLYGIANKPVAPANLVYMGVVTRVNANNGEIFVHVQNGFELEELHDVSVVNKQNGQGIVYDSATALWKNRWVLTDTTTLSNRINTKVNISDTSAMLTPYLRKSDTATLSNRINLKVNISDTASMLSPYYRAATANAALATKLNISDTAAMLLPYLRDADTATLSARIDQRVKYTDTSSMLSPYLRRADTTAMLSPYARTATVNAQLLTKVNISDTSAMLTPYLRKSDTTAMLSPYARTATVNASLATKLNISDTASMLSPYVRAAGYGLTKSGQTLTVDTLNIATRAWRQKGLDSLAAIEISGSGTTNYVSKFTNTREIGNSQIFDNGTNVGIGTATPTNSKLVVSGSSASTVGAIMSTDVAGTTSFLRMLGDVASQNLINWQTGTALRFATSSQDYTSFVERMRVTSAGHVGIGTQNPANNGAGETALEIRGANYPMLTISTPTISQFQGVGLSSGYTGTSTNHPFAILTNGITRQYIHANGRIGVNTTTDAGYQFDVSGSLRATSTIRSDGNFYNESANPSYSARLNTVDGQRINMEVIGTDGRIQVTRNSGAQPNLILATEGGENMRVAPTGNVGIGTGANPSERLDVNGRARIRTIDSTASAMNVLYADATGVIKKASATAFPGGSGTLNYVPKWTAANTLGNSQIFDNGTNVGIGTTSPAGKLVVVGANNNTYLSVDNAASGENYFGANAFHQFQTAGSPRMHINASGNVGIGSTNPLTRLHITSVDSYIASFNTSVTTADTSFLGLGNFSSYQPGTSGVSIASYHNLGASFATDMGLYTHSGASMGERVRITATGNVGIGTSLPAEKLEVVGNVLASNSAGTYPRFISTVGAKSWEIGYRSGTTNYEIREDGNTRMVIANGGNIGLGASSPYYRTHISQPKNTTGLFITNGPSAANDYTQIGFGFDTYNVAGAAIRAIAENPSASFNHHLTFHTYENTLQERMRITPTGNVGIANQNPVNRLHIYTPNRTSLTATGGGINVNYNGSTTGEFSTIGFSWASSINDATRWGMGLTGTNFASGLADLFFFNGGVERMRISSTGHVGIGVTPSAWSGVSPSLQFGVSPYIASSGQYLYLGSNTYYNGTNSIYTSNGAAATYAQSEGTHQFYTAGTGTAGGTATFTERMRIFNNGRVFIGASPTDAGYQLDVNGNTRVTGKIDVTANASIGHNVIRSGTSDIAAQIFNSNGWLLYGAEGANGGAIFTGSTPYAAVVGSGYNRPLQIATNNTVRMEIDSVGLVGINTVNPTERLDVNGRARIRTVDSTATATNMLYVDNSGVVKKTAVPGNNVSYITTTNTISTGWTFAKDSLRNLNHNFVNVIKDNNTNEGTATLQMAVYRTTSSFTTGSWQNVATIPGSYAPKTTIIFELPGYVSGTTYFTSGNVQFSGASEYTGAKVVRIDPSGNVDVRIGTVSASATAGGTNYVLIPILATWAIYNVPL